MRRHYNGLSQQSLLSLCVFAVTLMRLWTQHVLGQENPPSHFASGDSVNVYRKDGGNEALFQVRRPLTMMYLSESEEGRLAYVVECPGPDHNYGEPYRRVKRHEGAEYYDNYNPNAIVLELIVCDPQGGIEATTPLKLMHGGWYSHSKFLSERLVLLSQHSRLLGFLNWTYVNIETDAVWSFDRASVETDPFVVAYVDSSGDHLLNVAGSALLLDGTQIFPCYDATPASAWVSEDEYHRSLEEIDAAIERYPERGGDLIVRGDPWSPDGKYVAFLQAYPKGLTENKQVRISVLNVFNAYETKTVENCYRSVMLKDPVNRIALRGYHLRWLKNGEGLDLSIDGDGEGRRFELDTGSIQEVEQGK